MTTNSYTTKIDNFVDAFTVDVEDYFQVTAFENRISRSDWDKYDSRVEDNTNRLLSIMDEYGVRGTFFVLGWIADRFPTLVRRIHAEGHELGSHGYWHKLVYSQTPEEFSQDVLQSKEAICNACGVQVTAYRAPSFSIVDRSLWALDVLMEHGFTIDSSIFPIGGHDRYGIRGARREIHQLATAKGTILEFPPSAWHWKRFNIPVGGGYFRILPLALTQKALSMIRLQGRPAMFYIHPWEIDPDQPRIANVGSRNRFRHYSGLRRTESRLRMLFSNNRFGAIGDVLSELSPSSEPLLQS